MYRAIQESKEQRNGYKRFVPWLEGIAVAALVFIGVTYLFGLLLY